MLTPDELTEGLEDLKRTLIAMRPDEFEASQFEGARREMSGIRLQLKRLELERLAMQEDVERANSRVGEGSTFR
jgi:hypothetical protein